MDELDYAEAAAREHMEQEDLRSEIKELRCIIVSQAALITELRIKISEDALKRSCEEALK